MAKHADIMRKERKVKKIVHKQTNQICYFKLPFSFLHFMTTELQNSVPEMRNRGERLSAASNIDSVVDNQILSSESDANRPQD